MQPITPIVFARMISKNSFRIRVTRLELYRWNVEYNTRYIGMMK